MSTQGCYLADYANVPPIFGAIVSKRYATLHELETVYSYRDALDLAEIITVCNYNEWAAMEGAKNGNHS